MCCVISWEYYIVAYYRNTEFILTSMYQRYNFTLVISIINTLNVLYLILKYIDKDIIKLNKYFVFLIILNLIIGLWNCTLYNNHYNYGKFNNVINFELQLFVIKCMLSIMYALYNIIFYSMFKENDIITPEYSQVLIAKPVNDNDNDKYPQVSI